MPGLFNEGPPHARVSISQDVFHPQIASPTAVRKVLAELVRKKSREIPREIPSKGPSGPKTSKTGVGSAKNGWRSPSRRILLRHGFRSLAKINSYSRNHEIRTIWLPY